VSLIITRIQRLTTDSFHNKKGGTMTRNRALTLTLALSLTVVVGFLVGFGLLRQAGATDKEIYAGLGVEVLGAVVTGGLVTALDRISEGRLPGPLNDERSTIEQIDELKREIAEMKELLVRHPGIAK
jgi:hypothetical protein